jgi:2-polyprenyl-3-methyl-5-hydroxy-6-metoxy-1,4-benzoquinol methylase
MSLSMTRCPACGFDWVSTTARARVDGFVIERCSTCGLGRLVDPPSAEELSGLYAADLYSPGTPRAWPLIRSFHRRLNRQLLGRLGEPGGRLLDVGAGKGHFLDAARAAGWDADGLEYSAASATAARDLYGLEIRVADFMRLPPMTAGYDALSMIHVLEHLPDPAQALEVARTMLTPGGRILISVPNASSFQARLFGDRWLHLDLPRHLYHFTPQALSLLLRRTGFVVTHSDTSSPDMEVTGFVQSTLNVAGFERNVALRFLKRDAAVGSISNALGPLAVGAAALPGAVGWSLIAPRLGGGASLQVVAHLGA